MEEKHFNKCPICNRPNHKESKYCIFHASAEEKTEKEFKQALKKHVNKIKKENSNYNFEGFIFIGDINFKKDLNITVFKKANFESVTFEGEAWFMGAIFKEHTCFDSAIFKGEARFEGATFKEHAYFDSAIFGWEARFDSATFKWSAWFTNATFEWEAWFRGAIFEGYTRFRGATFKGYTCFDSATFKGDAQFEDANFFKGEARPGGVTFVEGKAIFVNTTFKGGAWFMGVTFEGEACFMGAIFEGDAIFSIKAIKKNIYFAFALFTKGKTLMIRTTHVKNGVLINFKKVCLENIYLELFLGEKTLIDFTKALLRSTTIEKDQIEDHILQEEKEGFSQAQKVYLLLKNNFHSIGRYNDESWAFKKEKDMERKSKSFYSLLRKYKKYSLFKKILNQSNLLKKVIIKLKIFRKWLFSKKAFEWINLAFSNFIYQYGESPRRVIRFALIIIFLFAFILNFSGIVNSDRTNMIIEFIKKSQGNEYTLRYLGATLGNFLDCLYFSVVTFTTLGYGDFQPLEGWSRFLVSSEALLGAFTMALFVYTFARRTGGR